MSRPAPDPQVRYVVDPDAPGDRAELVAALARLLISADRKRREGQPPYNVNRKFDAAATEVIDV